MEDEGRKKSKRTVREEVDEGHNNEKGWRSPGALYKVSRTVGPTRANLKAVLRYESTYQQKLGWKGLIRNPSEVRKDGPRTKE